ncbi:hypothetical protein VE25_05620 [Devosia geojensis]|uniref:VOC domain-containing protein n=1 Tax=Devosia geojensis TaxID=443610 RepID=A0A0F5FV28_9HYPH|nr:VOC family protein [Devosia geojensis]KKB12714.1 hypothetical protein VE25_05620 [Devosia geojensis]
MTATTGLSTNLLTRDIRGSTDFYQRLTGFELVRSEPWYALLAPGPDSDAQLGLIDWVSEFVPKAARGEAQGSYIEIVVPDVIAALDAVRSFDIEIIEQPGDVHGERAVLRDLDGHVVTLITPQGRFAVPPEQHVG